MGARIIQLADVRAQKSALAVTAGQLSASQSYCEPVAAPETAEPRFHFWSGASGQRYVHTIYSLLECPALPAGNFILVRKDDTGRRHALSVGRTTNGCSTLNLAEVRQRGAALGANEVHVHLLGENPNQCKLIEFDLRTGQFSNGAAAAVSPVIH